jgi:hypothetical protein
MENKFSIQTRLDEITEILAAERVSATALEKIEHHFIELETDAGYLEERRDLAEKQFSESLQHIENLNKILDKYKVITKVNPFDKKLEKVKVPEKPVKKKHLSFPKIGVGKSEMGGKGVFALEKIYANEPVELATVILCEKEHLDKTALADYYFNVDDGINLMCAVALGYGSLYNHSDKPSAHWILDPGGKEIIYIATCDIEEGEEITISYGSGYWSTPERMAMKKNVRTI